MNTGDSLSMVNNVTLQGYNGSSIYLVYVESGSTNLTFHIRLSGHGIHKYRR